MEFRPPGLLPCLRIEERWFVAPFYQALPVICETFESPLLDPGATTSQFSGCSFSK